MNNEYTLLILRVLRNLIQGGKESRLALEAELDEAIEELEEDLDG